VSHLSLTDADREEMLAAVGVVSIDELLDVDAYRKLLESL